MITIDDTLERFGQCGPEWRGGLSNHGPMAADALIAMGRPEAVEPWAANYIGRLEEAGARSIAPVDPTQWREALGDFRRLGDWEALFAAELARDPLREVLARWVPRLAPGFLASATHGLLRTAHAVRGLSQAETKPRTLELGYGLAYWAARYFALPAAPASQTLSFPKALAAVPIVPTAERAQAYLITQAMLPLNSRESFAPVINTLDTSGDLAALLSEYSATFAGLYLDNAQRAGIAFIHSVTAPSAIRLLAPHLPPETTRDLVRYAWQAGAAFIAVFSQPPPPRGEHSLPDPNDLIDRAVASGDEHAIKFTDACLREYALSPDPVFLHAAADASGRFRA